MKASRTVGIGLAMTMVVAGNTGAGDRNAVRRIGFMTSRVRPPSLQTESRYGSFLERLSELGYVDGRNLTIEWRFGEGDYTKLPTFASDLVNRNVEVIVTVGSEGIRAAQAATPKLPIVFVGGADVVAQGFVQSLNHPGGHMTGVTFLWGDSFGKQMELLVKVVPRVSRLAILSNPANPASSLMLQRCREAASVLHIDLIVVEAHSAAAIDAAITEASSKGAQALLWTPDDTFLDHRAEIAMACSMRRLPSIGGVFQYAEDGGLLGYGPDVPRVWRRLGDYVARILEGANAGDVPVEQPTKLELVVNRKTARALGLMISAELLTQADRVIE